MLLALEDPRWRNQVSPRNLVSAFRFSEKPGIWRLPLIKHQGLYEFLVAFGVRFDKQAIGIG